MQSDLFESTEVHSTSVEPLVEMNSAEDVALTGSVFSGVMSKMQTALKSPVEYRLGTLVMNRLIGRSLKLTYQQKIECIGCGASTNKSFSQGFCYKCFTTKAACDACIMSPEKCHFDQNTCREPGWGEEYCNQSHYVYLANSSGIKVGITRGTQVPTRWIDQGASQALPIIRTSSRLISGLVEVIFKQHVADKTNWRTMLKGTPESLDLSVIRDRLLQETVEELKALTDSYGLNSVQPLLHAEQFEIEYPVDAYLEKINSFNFDKTPEVSGVLKGIKGQYLIFDNGVINLRRFTGYHVTVDVLD